MGFLTQNSKQHFKRGYQMEEAQSVAYEKGKLYSITLFRSAP
jgi:ubiquitin